MATKSFSGQLDRPLNTDPAGGDKIFFYPLNTVGEIIESAASIMEIDSSGNYSITLGYNNYSLYYYSDVSKKKTFITTVTVAADTAVSTLPDLIGSTTPITSEVELAVQGYLADAEQARDDAQTAADEAELAQAATEALFDTGFNSNVATAVGLSSTPYPDVNLPMASKMVENLVGDMEYSRDGECYYIGISGNIEISETDIPCQTRYGTMFHGAFTNEILYSNDLSQWSDNGSVPTNVTESGILSADGESYMYQLTDSSTSSNARIYQNISGDGSDGVCFSCEIKNIDATVTRLSTQDGGATLTTAINIYWNGDDISSVTTTGGASVRYEYERLSNDAYYIRCFTTENIGTVSNGAFYIFPSGFQSDGSGVGSVLVSNVQFSFGEVGILPLLKTSGSIASVGETTCRIKCKNNFPVQGDGLTIVVDCKVTDSKAVIFSCDSLNFLLWRFTQDGDVLFRYKNDESTSEIAVNYNDTLGFSRYAIVIDSNALTVSIYADGVFHASHSVTEDLIKGLPINTEDYFYIGGPAQSAYANTRIENLKVYQQALSSDQIAALGGPQ